MKWNLFKFNRKPSRRQPFRHAKLRLEELEPRVVPSTDVTAYHQASPSPNPASTIGAGVNSNETSLTTANVNSTDFGKLYSTTVDGQVYAQPLYMENVNITTGASQGTHNVVFVATENDSLYAIDSSTGTILWQDALLTAEHGGTVTAVPSTAVSSTDINPEIGITATPVIDPTTNTIFVENKTQEVATDGTHFEHHLYSINIENGTINKEILIADSIGTTYVSGPQVKGTGAGSKNGVVDFNALRQLDRPGLTLVGGNIYLAYASHGDNGPYHGWILGYSETSLAATAVFNVNPNGSDDGIWQAGGTLAYETVNGNTYLYFETGNGTFDTSLVQSPFNSNLMIPKNGDYGDSFVKVEIDGSTPASGSLDATNNINGWGMHVADYFTPINEGNLSSSDSDLGSGGPLLLPASAGSTAHPNLMVGAGKEGRIYLIDRDDMGGYGGDAAGDGNSGTDNVVQETTTGAVNGSLDTPTFYDGTLYYVGGYTDYAKTFTISDAVMSSTATTQSSDKYGFPGSTPTISTDTNGNNAIVWDIAGPGTNQLRAYEASDGYSTELYTSAQAANSRDALGTAVKFTVPTVADGEVFVGTSDALVGYGLLQVATEPPAAPSNLAASPLSGSVINLSWTDNDTNPNTATSYTIYESINGSSFTQAGSASAGANSYAVGGLQASTTYYFKVNATNSIGTSSYSNTASATTTSQTGTSLDFSNGFSGSSGLLTYNGSAKINSTNAELTDGGSNEAGSIFSTNALNIADFSTQFTFQLTKANADGFTFTIQGDGPTAVGSNGENLGYGGTNGINNSVAVKFDLYNNAGEGSDSTGEYTDGATPTTPAIDLSSTGINLHSGDVFSALLSYNGTVLSVTIIDTTTNASASQSYTVNIPQVIGSNTGYVGFTGGTGGQSAVQQILTWTYSPIATSLPAAPSNLTGTLISGSEIDISWTNNANNQAGFLISRSTDGVNYTQIASVGAGVTMYADTSLSPGETAYYVVQATNADGNSADSNVFEDTTAIPPAPPVDVQATNITSTEIDLSWVNVATNATNLKILDQVGQNTAQVIVSDLAPTTTSYDVTGLTPGVTYLFEIDAGNSSGPSSSATFTTDTLPGQVTGLTATGGATGITLNWTADSGAQTYNVYRSTSSTQSTTPTWTGITGTTYLDASATTGTTYYYEVTAVDPDAASSGPSPASAAGEGAPSSEVSAQSTLAALTSGINFSSGFKGATGLTLNGKPTISGSNLQITDGKSYEARSVFDNTAQSISLFSTQFTFLITGGSNPTSDGFTFTIQNSGLTAVGPDGGGLGYGPDSTSKPAGIGSSLAIKFDLYNNQGEGTNSTGLYIDGAAPTNVGSVNLASSQINLHSGDVMQVNLTYDGSNLVETIKDTVTGGSFTHTYTGVNIPSIVGASTAYIGFTGGTGGLTAVQNIETWTFTPSTMNAPTNLVGVAQNGPQVQLTWNNNSTAATSFTIERTTDAAFTQNVTTFSVTAPATSTVTYVDTTVIPDTTYYYRIQAVNSSTTTVYSNPYSAVIPPPPATPSDGHATLITPTEVDLAWTNNATNADEYKIFREVVGNSFTQIATLSPTATSYDDTGLTPGTNYDYHIEAWNISGAADRTGANIYTVSPAITTLTASSMPGQIALAWTAPAGATDMTYNVYRGTSPGGEGATPIATGLTSTAFTDSSVNSGTTYYYVVTSVDPESLATNSSGESAPSNEVSVAEMNPVPSQVTGVTATAGTTSITLSWTAASGAQTYNIYRSTSSTESTTPTWTGITGTSYVDTNLTPGTSYYYQITAVNPSAVSPSDPTGEGPPSSVLEIDTVPAQVTGVSATSGTTSITLSWAADHGAQSYNIYRSTSSTESTTPTWTGITGTSYVDVNLTPGTTYYYEITAVDPKAESSVDPTGESSPSSLLEIDTVPAQVTGVSATAGSSSITLSWSAASGAQTYNIYRSTTSTESTTPTWTGITATSYVDANLTSGTTYYYQVTAVDPNAASSADLTGEGSASSQVSALAPGINFGNGFSGATGLSFNGGAAISGSNLQLADGKSHEDRSVYDNTAQAIGAFTTQFTFQIPKNSSIADGFTFTIQNTGLTAVGPLDGGGLGYGPDSTSKKAGIGKSIAIKFDLYNNQGEGKDSTGLYTDGAAPTNVGSIDLTSTKINLHSGDVMQVNLTYDGSNLVETIKDTVTGGSFTTTYTGVNIPTIVGASTAYVGFTAGTGVLNSVDNIQTWTFSPFSPNTFNAPTNLVGVVKNDSQVQLTWNNNSTLATSFILERSTNATFTQNVTSFSVTAPTTSTVTYVDLSVASGTTYYYRVQAVEGTTTSVFSNPFTAVL